MTGRQEVLGVDGQGMRGGHLSGNSIAVFCPRQPPTKPGLKGKHCSALYRTVGQSSHTQCDCTAGGPVKLMFS